MQRVIVAFGLIVSVFLIVRTWVELVTIDYSDPSSYAHDWSFGVTAWRRGERGDSVRRLADAEYRDKSATTTQILMRDTLTLAVVTTRAVRPGGQRRG